MSSKMKYKNAELCLRLSSHEPYTSPLINLVHDKIKNAGISYKEDGLNMHWLAKISTTCFIITYVLQIIALVKAMDDTDRLFECFSVISFCGMGLLKLLSMYRNHKHWNCILNIITELEKQQNREDTLTDTSFSYYIFAYTKRFQKISLLLSRMYGFSAVVFILSPFLEYYFLGTKEEFIGWPHILPEWTPLDSLSFFGYLFTIFIEAISAVYCVCVHVAFDLTSVGIIIFICGQFKLLRDYSKNIGEVEKNMLTSKKRNERAHRSIVKCHEIHVLLMKSSDELNKLLTNILGVYFFVATLTLCSVAVRLNSELSSMQLMSLLQYMCATLTQLYLYCYYGDNVLHESAVGMGEGPFGAAYWSLSPRIRRELAILGMGMMLPRRFYAGPFISLDLPSFIQVVRTAYSYYAVIRK